MKEDYQAYFENKVIPLITREHPEIASEISIRVEGSVGLGIDDEMSDMDATLYLPDKLWKEYGGQLQLTLFHKLEPFIAHPYSRFNGDPFNWPDFNHSEISIQPWKQMLCGKAESVIAGEIDVPWDDVTVEELLQLQLHPIIVDAYGILTRLKEVTRPERYPEKLWVKRLIFELTDLLGEPEALEKAVRRNRLMEAHMILGDILPKLFRVSFLINRQYYPWRRCYFRMFKELPVGPEEMLEDYGILESNADWNEITAAVHRIIHTLTRQILVQFPEKAFEEMWSGSV